jgi:hypothetical protein
MRGYCAAGGGIHELREYCGEPRPVVEIDPEDRGQVETFVNVMKRNGWTGLDEAAVEDMQAALRSLLAPPRPPEPEGRYAVVVDDEGIEWMRKHADSMWASQNEQVGPGVVNFSWRKYANIAVARVLSEGVTA